MSSKDKIHIIFFGTHDFAAHILKGLLKSPLFSVDLVITQPDRPTGRKQELQKSPVKILAEKHNLKIDQPENLKNYGLLVTGYGLQLGIVAQYGLLIPEDVLEAPKYGTLNVHTSLLPKYRGASPIQSALINGDSETGVTIMKMDKGLDTGPILLQKKLKIDKDDAYVELDKKLAKIGLKSLLQAVPDYTDGKLKPQPQDNSKATTCKQLSREDGKIDWAKTANEIYNLYRGLTPWPGIWTMWKNKRLKLLKIKPTDKKLDTGLVSTEKEKIYIGCDEGSIEVLELQLEGKKSMDAKTFLNGHKDINKIIL